MSRPRLVVIGAGGHARVVMEAARAAGLADLVALTSAADPPPGGTVDGVAFAGGDDQLPRLAEEGASHFTVALGSLGSAELRRRLSDLARGAGLEPLTIVHPSAWVSPLAALGEGVQVLARAVINPGAELGEGVMVNTAAVVEHDCRVGAFSHLAPGAILCGGATLGEAVHLGAGAVVREGITVGRGALVAAGAVVVGDIPPGARVAGCPARPLA